MNQLDAKKRAQVLTAICEGNSIRSVTRMFGVGKNTVARLLLAGVDPADLVTFAAAGVLCVVMTMIGTLVPTMRAVRVDPATAFRSEA